MPKETILSISFDGEQNVFLNRQSESGEMVQSLNVTKYEALMILLPALVDEPDYSLRLLTLLEKAGLARPNHK